MPIALAGGLLAGITNLNVGWVVLALTALVGMTVVQLARTTAYIAKVRGPDTAQRQLLQSVLHALAVNGGAALLAYGAGFVISRML